MKEDIFKGLLEPPLSSIVIRVDGEREKQLFRQQSLDIKHLLKKAKAEEHEMKVNRIFRGTKE
jgi:hypothetical protein